MTEKNADISISRSRKRGLGASLRLVHHLYGKLLQKQLAESGLSMAQYVHMRALREDGQVNQSELSARLGIDKASSTRLLDDLAKKKLIHRERTEKDRRMILVSLTECGRITIDQAMETARIVANLAMTGVEEDELRQFFLTLDRMIGNLTADN